MALTRPRYPALFLIALVTACLLWYKVAGQRRERISVRSLKAPITLVNLPTDLVIVPPVPEQVTLQLRGPLTTSQESRSQLEVLLDLSHASPGRHSYPIDDTDIQLPPNTQVVSVDPREIVLELERLDSIMLPVKPILEGAPAQGYTVFSVLVTPPQVRVQGPSTMLAGLVEVATAPISIEGASAPVGVRATIVLERPLKKLTPTPVDVLVDITPSTDRTRQPAPTPSPS